MNLLYAGLMDQLWNVSGRNWDGFAGYSELGCWSYRSYITAGVRGRGWGTGGSLHTVGQTTGCSLVVGHHGGGRGVVQVPGGEWLLGIVLRCYWGPLARVKGAWQRMRR